MDNLFKIAPLVLLSSLVTKSIISGATLSEALSIAAVCALSSLVFYKSHNKEIEELNKKLQDLNNKIDAKDKEFSEVKNYVSQVKLSQQMRSAKLV